MCIYIFKYYSVEIYLKYNTYKVNIEKYLLGLFQKCYLYGVIIRGDRLIQENNYDNMHVKP